MDTERLGRVLGVGARHAAKTLVSAADAAAAPHPRRGGGGVTGGAAEDRAAAAGAAAREQGPRRPAAAAQARTAAGGRSPRGIAEGGRRFGRAVWEPAARLSGVLWLEVTGLFFGIFALVAATAVWRLRGALHGGTGAAGAQQHTELLLAAGMLLVFGYFTASSFMAAARRSRRR